MSLVSAYKELESQTVEEDKVSTEEEEAPQMKQIKVTPAKEQSYEELKAEV
jgi:hypothetical protein